MSDLISSILEIVLEIKYWIKHGKQRKYEKENNLPKSIVWAPYTKQFFILFLIFIPVCFLFIFLTSIGKNENDTEERIIKISKLLEEEKNKFGKYPSELKTIIRNNPLRKNITLDYWKNEFVYLLSKDSLNYTIISLGSDQKLNTADDLKVTN
ncbi:type II secretion system protein GspG [Polaribacter sp. Hel1_85]|uniref:type II secretion system protein GspG n=1 Tax=Polaribacter sp. Hel1_85 TaxID=1250005 RepID=UPI00052C21DC|nr:hypothetical protein [Polaribacter sp. Hel1_85]KGL62723.1 hypothetical protein PHEL85_2517 [Polaribacter sp. Hel1_85]